MDKNRKPYLQLKKDLNALYSDPVRYLKELNVKESQFEKPYLDTEYRQMHFAIPDPDWPVPPVWKDGPFPRPPRPPVPPFPYYPDLDRPVYEDCECCFFVYWEGCSSGTEYLPNGGERYGVFKEHPFNPDTHEWTIEGGYKNFRTYPPHPSDPAQRHSAFFDFDGDQAGGDGYSFVILCYVIGNICKHCVDYWAICADACPAEVTFEFDSDNTSGTIAKNSSTTVYILGGSSPFTWGDPGLGYSWSSGSSTIGRSNVLNCVDGDCGDQFNPTVTASITDNCDTNVSGILLNTSGQWVPGDEYDCRVGGSSTASCEKIDGANKYIVTYHHTAMWPDLQPCILATSATKNVCYGYDDPGCRAEFIANKYTKWSCYSDIADTCCCNQETMQQCIDRDEECVNKVACVGNSARYDLRLLQEYSWEC